MKLGKRNDTKELDVSTRERLLQSAAKLFAKQGYDRVSVREIMRESQGNISLVSYYFGGKEQLYREIFTAFFKRMSLYIEDYNAKLVDPKEAFTKKQFVEAVRTHVRNTVEEFNRHGDVKLMLHREALEGFPRTKDLFTEHMATVRDRFTAIYKKAQSAGYLRTEIHIQTFAMLMHQSIETYLVARLCMEHVRSVGINPLTEANRFVDQIEEIFLKGALS